MRIYVIAGPPGIGKSTNAKNLVAKKTPIIDQDLAGYQYKKQGFTDYSDLATFASNQKIKEFLFSERSFALELNLRFQSHYDYLKSIAAVDRTNEITLILFFTDSIDLCIDRAKIRHMSGGHEVRQEVIEEMYNHTFPLFEQNKGLFSKVRLINVSDKSITHLRKGKYPYPKWVIDNRMTAYLV
jgi:predicted ABC-type ATPase